MKRAKVLKVLAAVVGSVAMLGLALSPIPALADPVLDFKVPAVQPSTAHIDYAGGLDPLVGSGIVVDSVVGLGTPLNDGVGLPCVDCTLDFTTGANIGGWNWAGGGSITITGFGCVSLMSGSFDSASVLDEGNNFKIAGAAFTDTKDSNLTTFFGLPSGATWSGNFGLTFFASGLPAGAAFSSSLVTSGDVTNTIPEPASLLLLGSGLIGLGFWRWKNTHA